MLSRIQGFAPSLVVMACLALLSLLVNHLLNKKYESHKESVSWTRKHLFTLFVPWHLLIRLGAPVVEELIFRAPLVIAFAQPSTPAWIAIVLSSSVFAVIHLKNPPLLDQSLSKLFERYEEGKLESDHLPSELEKVKKEGSELPRWRRVAARFVQILIPFAIGIVAGYLGIKHQSLWVPVGVHFFVNLAGPLLAGAVFLLFSLYLWVSTEVALRRR